MSKMNQEPSTEIEHDSSTESTTEEVDTREQWEKDITDELKSY